MSHEEVWPGVSHLFFVDNFMLFVEFSKHQIKIIMDYLKRFTSCLVLNINLSKSSIFCSPNTINRLKRRLCDASGIPVTNHLGKYLRVPSLQKRVSKRSFGYILEGMLKKLSNWKMDTLSLVGRMVHIQSSLAIMPVYMIQVLELSIATYNDIDKICRNFLWGDMENKKKIHLVNWKEVCTLRDRGGLSLRKAMDFNLALFTKLAWQVPTCPSKFWVKIMREKCIKDKNLFTAIVPSSSS